jgi:hypothetical protein
MKLDKKEADAYDAILEESDLFSADWYLSQYPDVAEADLDPLMHYLQYGAAEGRDPGPEFSTRAYLERNPDVAAAGVNPLFHYVRYGKSEGRDTGNYKSDERMAELAQTAGGASWIMCGRVERLRTHPNALLQEDLNADIALVAASHLFHKDWYLSEYNDVAQKGVDPAGHYVRDGAWEGRNPSPWFNTEWYISENEDVLRLGINPLVHYLRYGQNMGILPMPHIPNLQIWWSGFFPDLKTRIGEKIIDGHNRNNVLDTLERICQNPLPPAIIVPVIIGHEHLEDCLQSLLLNTREKCRIIVINDVISDLRVCKLLSNYQGIGPIEVYHNSYDRK